MSLLGISKKGKWIVGGVALFAIIATASTGLATWVIGQNKVGETKGNITVSTVDDRSCTVTITEGIDLKVNFGPCLVDDSKTPSDHVISPSGDTTEEDLDFTIKGTLSTSGYGSVTVFIAEGDIVSYVETDYNETDSTTYNYITMPSEFEKVTGGWQASIDVSTTTEGETTTYSFSQKFSFGWGHLSGGKNPVNYFTDYDEAKSYLEMLSKLNEKTFSVTVTPVYGTTTSTSE